MARFPKETYTKESLQKVIDFYYMYHHQVNDYYTIAKYFFYPVTEAERFITNRDPFFHLTANSSWAMVVVDLCKIFQKSSSQRYNLNKLFDDLKTNLANKPILDQIGELVIDQCISDIIALGPTIDKLKFLRDKHYAHVDDISLDLNTLINPSFVETEEALNVLAKIINRISYKIFDAEYMFNDQDWVNAPSIVQDILKQRML
jgi:hypothetical protein